MATFTVNTISTAEELFDKLSRTFYRRSAYGEEQLDWVFDFAVTAWHLTDWIAAARSQDLRMIQETARQACPPLTVCEQVCNGYKHFDLKNPRLQGFRVDRDVKVSANRVGVSRTGRAGEGKFDIVMTPAVIIRDLNGQAYDAMDLFIEVLRYWRAELGMAS